MAKIDAYDIILRPVISEKSTLASEYNQIIFDVRGEASKAGHKAGYRAALFGQSEGGQHAGSQG